MTDPKRLACVPIHRERRAVQLTNYGQRLAARARQVLDVCSTARAEMRAILRKRLLLASCRLLAFLLDRSYISYQRPHCGSGSSPEWPSYIGTGDHVADRCAATGDEIRSGAAPRPGVSVEGHRRRRRCDDLRSVASIQRRGDRLRETAAVAETTWPRSRDCRFWFATRTLFSLARRSALRRCCSGGFLVASRCCGHRSDGNAARTSTGPADALLPNHGCHPPLMRTLTLTIGAYAIISNACICN